MPTICRDRSASFDWEPSIRSWLAIGGLSRQLPRDGECLRARVCFIDRRAGAVATVVAMALTAVRRRTPSRPQLGQGRHGVGRTSDATYQRAAGIIGGAVPLRRRPAAVRYRLAIAATQTARSYDGGYGYYDAARSYAPGLYATRFNYGDGFLDLACPISRASARRLVTRPCNRGVQVNPPAGRGGFFMCRAAVNTRQALH